MIFILPFVIALSLCAILTPLVINWAKKYRLVDDPRVHKHPAVIHHRVIPRAGGLPIFLAVVLTSLLFLEIEVKLYGIFLGGLILVGVGLWDDKYDLPVVLKLIFQLLAAGVVVGSGVNIPFITNPLSVIGLAPAVIRLDSIMVGFLTLADLAALFWIIWVINMVNFSSGVDGQMPGIVFVALVVIFAASLRYWPDDPNQIVVSKLALAGAGATLGFLIYNFYPAKIFPGDSGSYFLGFLVAVVGIFAGAKVGTAILVMAVPLIDGVFTVLRRIYTRKSPFLGDRKHLHHRLLELGWSQARVALFYWLLCAILGTVALSLNSTGKLFAGAVMTVIIVGGLLWLNMNLPQRDLR